MKKWFYFRVTFIFFLLICIKVLPNTWYVHPDSILNSIQSALDSCSSGDTVLVSSGTYYENIIWPDVQGISLLGELDADSTIIDGNGVSRVISISYDVDSNTIINGFTIQNGYTTEDGGGIYCYNSSPMITGNIIIDNTCTWMFGDGGGISCSDASPIIRDNIIIQNYTDAYGGGIYCESNSSPQIIDNTIEDNYASNGGGIYCSSGSAPVIRRDTIFLNTSSGYYYGGGGIYCEQGSSPVIKDNFLSYNTTNGMGGGIYCNSSSALIKGNSIDNNLSSLGGGGIYCCSSPIIRGNIITSNNTFYEGGGIYCNNAAPTIDSCTIKGNYVNGIYCENNAAPSVNYCNILVNSGYGLINDDASILVNAEYNWWGDTLGPGGVGPGGGDEVSNYVDYDPWLSDSVYISGIDEKIYRDNEIVIFDICPVIYESNVKIEYSVPVDSRVHISIYNVAGVRIRILLNKREKKGLHTITWDGRDQRGCKVRDGLYFLRIKAENYTGTGKLILLR